MLGFTRGGVTSTLAGPIGTLEFQPLSANGVSAALSPSTTKYVHINLDVLDADNVVSANRFSTAISFRKNVVSALYYVGFAGNNFSLPGLGAVQGAVHANNQASKNWAVFQTGGGMTDIDQGISVLVPSANPTHYLITYQNFPGYAASASVVVNGDFTFATGNVYTGIYYLDNGGTARFGSNVIINGSVVAEGRILVNGNGVTITPTGKNPALAAGQDVSITGTAFRGWGPVFAQTGISITGPGAYCSSASEPKVALAANGPISLASADTRMTGSIISSSTLTIQAIGSAVLIGDASHAAAIANGVSTSGGTIQITGSIISGTDISFTNAITTSSGSFIAKNNATIAHFIWLIYVPAALTTPPLFLKEQS
jgi:hypothetical protein